MFFMVRLNPKTGFAFCLARGILQTGGRPLNSSETTKSTRKITNRVWAIHADVPAMPAKPNKAAISAMIRKTIA
jgi:hypothetical protein